MLNSTKNPYKKFSLRIILCFTIIVLIDQLIGSVIRHYYFKQGVGAAYRTTYSMDSTYAKVLVFGSSRANRHYVPEIFENNLKMTFYNTGRDGNSIFYNYAVLKSILNRYKPSIVILDIDPYDLYYNEESYDRLSALLPYYSYHPEIRDIIKLRGPYEGLKLLSAIYPFNSILFSIGTGNLGLSKTQDNKGYVPLLSYMKDSILIRRKIPKEKIDENKVSSLQDFINICKKNRIEIYLVCSPMFLTALPDTTSNLLEKISERENIKYWCYLNNPVFLNHKYFSNDSHLNHDGAIKFSLRIASQLNNVRRQQTKATLSSY